MLLIGNFSHKLCSSIVLYWDVSWYLFAKAFKFVTRLFVHLVSQQGYHGLMPLHIMEVTLNSFCFAWGRSLLSIFHTQVVLEFLQLLWMYLHTWNMLEHAVLQLLLFLFSLHQLYLSVLQTFFEFINFAQSKSVPLPALLVSPCVRVSPENAWHNLNCFLIQTDEVLTREICRDDARWTYTANYQRGADMRWFVNSWVFKSTRSGHIFSLG